MSDIGLVSCITRAKDLQVQVSNLPTMDRSHQHCSDEPSRSQGAMQFAKCGSLGAIVRT